MEDQKKIVNDRHLIINWGKDPVPWLLNLKDELTTKFGQGVARFAVGGQLPGDHTQNINKRYESLGKIGTGAYVTNQMPNMQGIMHEKRREMTQGQFERLKLNEAEEVEITDESTTNSSDLSRLGSQIAPANTNVEHTVRRYYRTVLYEMPIAKEQYKNLYTNDPFDPEISIRVKVSGAMIVRN